MKTTHSTLILCILSLILLFGACESGPQYELNSTITLDQGWSFKKKGDDTWLPAQVPGCVHTDLLRNEKIPQPFYRNNEKSLQWIDKEDWMYECTFTLDSSQVEHNRINLNFKGLDTYANVKLNGRPVLRANNMFRSWQVSVKDILQAGDNHLEIEFLSPVNVGLEKLNELGYGLPAANDQSEVGDLADKKVSVFTRKAPYHYGWDWGPRFVTSGIWRPVELEFINYAKIEDVYFRQSLVNDKQANIDAILELDVYAGGDYTIAIHDDENEAILSQKTIAMEQGINSVTLAFSIENPELWWPNGLGEQHRYKFKVSLMAGETIMDTLSHNIGLRSIELVRDPDSMGTSFYFRVNDVPVFAKGANYIPNDNFLTEVSPEKYETIIASAAEANMNMLRVWGGGIYENEIFYDLCDRYGLLVWQDFMFACSMYPGDDDFLGNVEKEAIDNVKRLRNYGSIALWCGNNEIDAAWCEGDMNCGWGWKQRYSPEQRKTIWQSYDTLFHKILPNVISLYDPTRSYWPSSPQADWGEHASYTSNKGDVHYWGVWHGNEPFSAYYKVIGRFMSEYGFQSLPAMQSIKKFTLPHDWDFESEILISHQRSGYGNSRILDYMERLYPVPDDFEELLYVGQVMQAEAIKSAILAHRAAKPYCMGSLYWQLNDCWPSASWSSIDYYTSWKALQFFAKKAFEPVSIAFYPDADSIKVYLNSDLLEAKAVEMKYTIMDFAGNIHDQGKLKKMLDPYGAVEALVVSPELLGESIPLGDIFLLIELESAEGSIASDHYFFTEPKSLNLPKADIEMQLLAKNNKTLLRLSSSNLVKNLYLWIEDCEGRFGDNYFDLLPGKSVEIEIPDCRAEDITLDDIQYLSLNKILIDQTQSQKN